MAFAQEIKDFVGGFSTAYETVKSPEERKAEKLKNAYMEAQTKKLTPTALDLEDQRADVDYKRAMTEKALRGDSEGDKAEQAARTEYYRAGAAKRSGATDEDDPYSGLSADDITGSSSALPYTDAYGGVIGGIESAGSGDYAAVGVDTGSMGQALGRYGIMEANLPAWSKQYLGKEMTRDEFLASPEAQDTVFNGEFGRLAEKHGPEGAARAWFAGERGMNNPNAKDALGTSVAAYSQKFRGGAAGAADAMATGGEIPIADGLKAAQEGLAFAAKEEGLTSGGNKAIPDGSETDPTKVEGFLKGKGAAPPDLMQALYKKVDPEGKLPLADRNMLAIGQIYQHYMKAGHPEKAAKAAANIVQYYRIAQNRYAGLAAAAAQGGDIDGAVKALEQSYAYIPNGMSARIEKDPKTGGYAFEFTDMESGDVIQKGVASPQEIGAMAMGVSPTNFDNFIYEAAGIKVEKAKAAEGSKTAGPQYLDPKDRAAAYDALQATGEEFFANEALKDQPALQGAADQVTHAAEELYFNNEHLGPKRSYEVAANMIYVDPKNPTTPAYKIIGEPKDGLVTVNMKGYKPITMPLQTYYELEETRKGIAQEFVVKAGKEARRGLNEDAAVRDVNKAVDDLRASASSRVTETPGAPSSAIPVGPEPQGGIGSMLPENFGTRIPLPGQLPGQERNPWAIPPR